MLSTFDLRAWLQAVDDAGELGIVRGADWDLEVGAIAEVNARQSPSRALLFDEIAGYPSGYRVLVGSMGTPTRFGITYGVGRPTSDAALVEALRGKPLAWEEAARRYAPETVMSGPILENVQDADAYDLLRFPAPKWHEGDGGRYLGTGSAVITQGRDTGIVNVGCYRMMVHNSRDITVNVVPGKHGRFNYESWWRHGEKAPIVACFGQHPLLFALAGAEISPQVSELSYAGAVLGQPVEVIRGEFTGLPIPAYAEIAIEGWISPDHVAKEGPFGEWTGYYSDSHHEDPILEVARVYFRNDPIILGAPPARPPHDFSYYRAVFKSAAIHDALVGAGIPGVRGVWSHESGGGRQFVVVSITQMYAGHARQAGFLASQLHAGAYMGKFVVVVDDDIDPRDLNQVIWALCFRCDPDQDIDYIRRAWGSRADPLCFDHDRPFNSRAIIDACIPWEHRHEMPRAAKISPQWEETVREKWGHLWG